MLMEERFSYSIWASLSRLMSEEGLKETPNKLIHVGEPIEMDDELFEKQLEMLEKACTSEAKDIKQIVASVVKTYHPDLED